MRTIKTIEKSLEKFIEVKSVDSIVTHLRQIFLSEKEDAVCGAFKPNQISIWISSNRWIGAFIQLFDCVSMLLVTKLHSLQE